MNDLDLSGVLTDVRRAYRLVVSFQRRMNEVFHAVHELLQKDGLEFKLWWPYHHNPPLKHNKPQFQPQTWAWDLFPGLCMTSEWRDDAGPVVRRVWMALETDTALADAKTRGGQPEPTSFGPVEDSRTELWFGLYTADATPLDWDVVWKEELEARWKTAKDKPIDWTLGRISGTYECFCVPVQELTSPDAVARLVTGRVNRWLATSKEPSA